MGTGYVFRAGVSEVNNSLRVNSACTEVLEIRAYSP